jgi:hypothetical protein
MMAAAWCEKWQQVLVGNMSNIMTGDYSFTWRNFEPSREIGFFRGGRHSQEIQDKCIIQ